MVKAKVFVYAKPFEGAAQSSDFRLTEEEVRPLKDGEYLVEAIYLSVDPCMRIVETEVGKTAMGGQVGRIIQSKNPKFPVGKYIFGYYGWRTYTIGGGGAKGHDLISPEHLLPELGNLSPSLALGVLGMPGNTANFGLLDVIKPKAGETLVVSGAAGAVGSIVGQIAKIRGLKVIGIAGTDEKGKWLTEELGFDNFINYKKENVSQRLKVLAPEGIDCYFDNVGGDITKAVFENMKLYGRVAVIGLIALYDDNDARDGISERTILVKELEVKGFNIQNQRWRQKWMEGIEQNLKWINEGKLKYQETVTDGFENIPEAFTEMMKGGNTGKAIVKV